MTGNVVALGLSAVANPQRQKPTVSVPKDMKVGVLVGAEAAYACIETDTFRLDVKLPGGRGPSEDLRRVAEKLQEEVDRKQKRVERILQAAAYLEALGPEGRRGVTHSARG